MMYRHNKNQIRVRYFISTSLTGLVLLIAALSPFMSHAQEDISLPTLGDATSGVISLQQEKSLGQYWLKSLRRQVKTFDDPVVNQYLNDLVYRLIPNSELSDRSVQTIIVDSAQLNAFAVPGGIVGINAGLFLYANNEQEFSSVLAHELAHLSQRHFARSVERQQNNTPLALAGLLASIVIGAAAGPDAGLAVLAGSQALSVQNQLSYSRQNEQEADRIGINTLYQSGFDPYAMPAMFERMLQQSRLQGEAPPEYLSTHPVTESRVADTRNRAEQYPKVAIPDSLDFYEMKARVIIHYANSPNQAVNQFQQAVKNSTGNEQIVQQYALAAAYIDAGNPGKATPLAEALTQKYPHNLIYRELYGAALLAEKKLASAEEHLKTSLNFSPKNYPLQVLLARTYETQNRLIEAQSVLKVLTKENPQRPDLWYQLAEVNGLAGDIIDLYRARAEYFYLLGNFEKAQENLRLAIKRNGDRYPLNTVLQSRMDSITREKKENRF
ncbi:MAG: M48 family metalloprotease [Pseudomonadales bacterium]|nr:M48 family metalloprotease [Pseudomonadales bacterium]